MYWHEICMLVRGGDMNQPVEDALLLIDSIFKQAIAREKEKQAKCKKEVRSCRR